MSVVQSPFGDAIRLAGKECKLSIPLDKLIDKDCNVYELTCVAIKEAGILSAEEAALGEQGGSSEKVVSAALAKVLNDEVEYTIEDGDK